MLGGAGVKTVCLHGTEEEAGRLRAYLLEQRDALSSSHISSRWVKSKTTQRGGREGGREVERRERGEATRGREEGVREGNYVQRKR